MALFEIRGLAKRFGANVVLTSVDLDVFEGERITLIGESGSGKSVLLKIMIGLQRPDAGTILFDGKDVTSLPERDWVEVRKRIGMLFQFDALFDSLSVGDNVAYGLREQRVLDEATITQRVGECLAQVSLPGIEAMRPATLSGGMRKRVGLARAIASRPSVVLYDEPTEGLDPINVTRVDRLLDSLRREHGVTAVVATQNMTSAFTASDRLALVHGGVIAKVGSPNELRAWDDPRIGPFLRASELRAKTRPSHPG